MSGLSDRRSIDVVSAGAGSGKTYSLTARLEALLVSGEVTPAGVIATTFTRRAAAELRERVRQTLLASGRVELANRMERALIGTVNGVCGELLQRFTYEAGIPPDQEVLDETQANRLFYQAMEQALAHDSTLMRQMNATCHRLQVLDRQQQLNWRGEVKRIADAARANNQGAQDIRDQGKHSADELLAFFPDPLQRDLDRELLNAIEAALAGIDTVSDRTRVTREYLTALSGVRAGLYKQRATWAEWIKLGKAAPGARSRAFAEPVAAAAAQYERHPLLHRDIRFFAEQLFAIAAASLETYQQLKQARGLIDFVDQEQQLFLLLDQPAVCATLAGELELLMVDEFQDTSPIQLALFLKLSELAGRVVWVGDIKQSIYGFRGADPTLMQAVVDSITGAGQPLEVLSRSWRSTPELVAYINHLFVPAFAPELGPEQVALQPTRDSLGEQAAVETWRLQGRNKTDRALALAAGVRDLLESDQQVSDREERRPRPVAPGDIAVLCRTHDNLDEVAAALAAMRIPLRYQRPGLLGTPEGCLAMACLRCLLDPRDSLASAEIHTLTTSESPEAWLAERIGQLEQAGESTHDWRVSGAHDIETAFSDARERLPFVTPVETLELAISTGAVRETVKRWGPTDQRSRQRLNNLAALLDHAREYQQQCAAQNQPATGAGLALWLYELASAATDLQADSGNDAAVQLVTHHGAKGLEWPIVIAMDLDARLRPRLWGLSVLPAPEPVDLDRPLAGRRLRYWPSFSGRHTRGVPLLEKVAASPAGAQAMDRETEEARRLLYVSLTRARDTLVLAMPGNAAHGEWMDTLSAPWMLPEGDALPLPDGPLIPSRLVTLSGGTPAQPAGVYHPWSLECTGSQASRIAARLSPSACPPRPGATTGEVVRLGEPLALPAQYDPGRLGAALHAVIASELYGQRDHQRILDAYGVNDVITERDARRCATRLTGELGARFDPLRYYCECPIQYRDAQGRFIQGWADLLLETRDGFVLIDHKTSTGSEEAWGDIALSYSGQLAAYAEGVRRATDRAVIGCWIHFAVGGGLVEVC